MDCEDLLRYDEWGKERVSKAEGLDTVIQLDNEKEVQDTFIPPKEPKGVEIAEEPKGANVPLDTQGQEEKKDALGQDEQNSAEVQPPQSPRTDQPITDTAEVLGTD